MKHWKISDYIEVVLGNRRKLQRIFFALSLVSLAINFYIGTSVTQIGANPLLNQDLDPVYWIFMRLHLPGFISERFALWFDGLLVTFCIASMLWTRYRIFPIIFFVFHFLYFLEYNILSGHHYISIGLLVMSFPFIFSNNSRFTSMFILCRFIFCFMMFSAAFWKIARGNVYYVDQANMLLITTHINALVTGENNLLMKTIKWLLLHKSISHLLWIILIALESVFVVGFFTFRLDKVLLLAYLLFFVGGWVFFNIYNYDNLLFLLTLVPVLKLLEIRKYRF
ncbi:MAG: hypothetical protein ABI415_08365 [Flavitalea sp.]